MFQKLIVKISNENENNQPNFFNHILGGLFGFAVTKALKTKDKSSNILKVLQENCDYKEINQIIYAKGINTIKTDFKPNMLNTNWSIANLLLRKRNWTHKFSFTSKK